MKFVEVKVMLNNGIVTKWFLSVRLNDLGWVCGF